MFRQALYRSHACGNIDSAEISNIISKARVNNAKMNITGLMVFDGKEFQHVLEGPPAAVQTLLHKLFNDSRHTNLELMAATTVEQRDFANWHLAFIDTRKIRLATDRNDPHGPVDFTHTLSQPGSADASLHMMRLFAGHAS